MKSNEIKTIIMEIRDSIKKNNVINENDYKEFKKDYPKIYSMCIDKDFDMNQMNYFLQKLQEVENNNSTQHDASVQIGSMLVNKYVKPELK